MIRPNQRILTRLLTTTLVSSVVSLSFASEYTLVPSDKINLDVASMLTPSGILNNLVLTADHPLRPYYFNPTVRTGIFDQPLIGWLILAVSAQAFALLALGRREKKS